jgi:hypothetical protein
MAKSDGMTWVEFTGPFNWDAPERKGRTTFHFQGGQKRFLRDLCAGAAVAAGKAKEIDKPAVVEPSMIPSHPLLGPMAGDASAPGKAKTAVPETAETKPEA